MENILLKLLAFIAVGVIIKMTVRTIINSFRLRAADKHLKNNEFSKARQLYIYVLSFKLEKGKGVDILEKILNVYELSGNKLDNDSVKKAYDDLIKFHSENLNPYAGSDPVIAKFNAEFIPILPEI